MIPWDKQTIYPLASVTPDDVAGILKTLRESRIQSLEQTGFYSALRVPVDSAKAIPWEGSDGGPYWTQNVWRNAFCFLLRAMGMNAWFRTPEYVRRWPGSGYASLPGVLQPVAPGEWSLEDATYGDRKFPTLVVCLVRAPQTGKQVGDGPELWIVGIHKLADRALQWMNAELAKYPGASAAILWERGVEQTSWRRADIRPSGGLEYLERGSRGALATNINWVPGMESQVLQPGEEQQASSEGPNEIVTVEEPRTNWWLVGGGFAAAALGLYALYRRGSRKRSGAR